MPKLFRSSRKLKSETVTLQIQFYDLGLVVDRCHNNLCTHRHTLCTIGESIVGMLCLEDKSSIVNFSPGPFSCIVQILRTTFMYIISVLSVIFLRKCSSLYFMHTKSRDYTTAVLSMDMSSHPSLNIHNCIPAPTSKDSENVVPPKRI